MRRCFVCVGGGSGAARRWWDGQVCCVGLWCEWMLCSARARRDVCACAVGQPCQVGSADGGEGFECLLEAMAGARRAGGGAMCVVEVRSARGRWVWVVCVDVECVHEVC